MTLATSTAALPQRHLTARAGAASSASATTTATSSAPSASSTGDVAGSTTLDGKIFLNHGLVAFGRISASDVDSYGESIGGVGSAIALESFSKQRDGSFAGAIRLQPDRGHNQGGAATSDYRARSHLYNFAFTPLAQGAATPAGENLKLTYRNTLLYKEVGNNYTTGLDPDQVRPGNPPLPVASYDNHVPFDTEGLVDVGPVLIASDEYGPYIYAIEKATGHVFATLSPPAAIVPMINGKDNFTALTNPTTGRTANQGFEGLTLDRSNGMLWALLQSATIQDGGASKTTNRYSRLLGWQYDVTKPFNLQPTLKEEYVVELPASNKGNTRASSELHIVGEGVFLVLARDGNGFGDTKAQTTYKEAALLSIKENNPTNIAGTKYDQPQNPVSPGGKLNSDITPAVVHDFVDLVNTQQLAKFGLRNDGTIDNNLIASKLESLALAPAGGDDYYLFIVSDNDFITTSGRQAGQAAGGSGPYVIQDYQDPYAVQYTSQDTQAFVYRVTLPGYNQPAFLGPN